MENTERDVALSQASETTTQNNNSVTESLSSSARAQESTMVTLLKTIQEQLQVCIQLLFGLSSETKRPLSWKRKISMSDLEDEESFSLESRPPQGKTTCTESATISVALHRQEKPSAIMNLLLLHLSPSLIFLLGYSKVDLGIICLKTPRIHVNNSQWMMML